MRGTPHIAGTPYDGRPPSVPARPPGPAGPPAASRPPVFIDPSGRRRRALQGAGLVVGCVCLGYLLFVGTLAGGLLEPVGTHPPGTDAPAPAAGHDSGGAADGRAARPAGSPGQ